MSVVFYQVPNSKTILTEVSAPTTNESAELKVILPNTVEASHEKHIPVCSVENNKLKVNVGSQPHPMLEEHYIEWIYVETSFGGTFCHLSPGDPPEVLFELVPTEVLSVYAYCNLHGLWQASNPPLPEYNQIDTAACSAEFGCIDPTDNVF